MFFLAAGFGFTLGFALLFTTGLGFDFLSSSWLRILHRIQKSGFDIHQKSCTVSTSVQHPSSRLWRHAGRRVWTSRLTSAVRAPAATATAGWRILQDYTYVPIGRVEDGVGAPLRSSARVRRSDDRLSPAMVPGALCPLQTWGGDYVVPAPFSAVRHQEERHPLLAAAEAATTADEFSCRLSGAPAGDGWWRRLVELDVCKRKASCQKAVRQEQNRRLWRTHALFLRLSAATEPVPVAPWKG